MGSVIDFEFKTYKGSEEGHSCAICLAGRAGDGGTLARDYWVYSSLHKTTFVGVTPWRLNIGKISKYYAIEWYPQPYSAMDQREAVAGLDYAKMQIERIINKVIEVYKVPRERIAILGFSAGAVMSLYTATQGEHLAAVISHAGAVLEPNEIPKNTNDTPILLIHGTNDSCFDWYERYVPMKNALIRRKYRVSAFEHSGSHWVTPSDVVVGAKFLSSHLDYNEYNIGEYEVLKRSRKSLIKKAKREAIPIDWEPGSTRSFF